MDKDKIFEYDYESQGDKIKQKTKESPMMVLGVVGFTIIAGLGIYKFKSRPKDVSASVYLTQLRVIAQGAVVGALMGSVIYNMCKEGMGSDDKKN